MKKQKVVLMMIVLLFMFSTLLVAVPEETALPEPVRSGTLTFAGKIEAGLYFSVREIPTDSFNLLTEENLQPKGPGVEIGTWTLRVDNPPITTSTFRIEYTYAPLRSIDSDDEIEFEVLERQEGLSTASPAVKKTTDITTIIIDAESRLSTFTKSVSARLTPEGVQTALVAAASLNYQSNITVTLLAE